MTALSVMSLDGPGNKYDDVLSMVTNGLPQLASLFIEVGSATPDIAKANIQAAWPASGRPFGGLDVSSRYVPPDRDPAYDADAA